MARLFHADERQVKLVFTWSSRAKEDATHQDEQGHASIGARNELETHVRRHRRVDAHLDCRIDPRER